MPYKSFKERNSYGGEDTAFNGIWLYLQGHAGWESIRRSQPVKITSYNFMKKTVEWYLKENNIPISKSKNYGLDNNCKKIQKAFTPFREWVQKQFGDSKSF